MRYISVKNTKTGHEDIVSVSKAAKIINVDLATMYRREEKSRQFKDGIFEVNFDVKIHKRGT